MKRILKIASILALVTGLSSCLKEKSIIGSKPQNIVEFYTTDNYISPVSALYPVYGKSFVTGEKGSFDVTVSYSGTDVAPQDITVDIAVDPTALTKYNTKAAAGGDDEYTILDPSTYKLSTNSVTIKKGERRATFKVDVELPLNFNFDELYALPLTIKSSSTGTISGNFGSVLYNVGGKNQYHGLYHATGVFNHPTLGPRTFDSEKEFVTTGSATIMGSMGDIANTFRLTVNANNTVTIQGTVNAPNDVIPQPGKTNTYDPATKTFDLHYQYAGGGGNRVIDEKLVFIE